MADADLTALAGFTPVVTDNIYGVQDPAGSKTPGKLTLTQIYDLFVTLTKTITGVFTFGAAGNVAKLKVAGNTSGSITKYTIITSINYFSIESSIVCCWI